jgi:transcription elongation factor Elf1
MIECPGCHNLTFKLEEIRLEPTDATICFVVCTNCGEWLGCTYEKDVIDRLDRIEDKIDQLQEVHFR